ncbi:MAG: hypothetical protein R6V27_10410 [Balneolaceae bacterium]
MKTLLVSLTLIFTSTVYNSSTTHEYQSFPDFEVETCIDTKDANVDGDLISLRRGCETGGAANNCCPYWDVEYSVSFGFWVTVTCSTGGQFQCESEGCPDVELKEIELEEA